MGTQKARGASATIAVSLAFVFVLAPGALADAPCSGLTAGTAGPRHNIEYQTISGVTATRGDLRAYNPFVIDQNGAHGLSAAWVMLTKASNTQFWAQTGWLKSPRNFGGVYSPNKYNPVVFYQIHNEEYFANGFRNLSTGGTVVTPPCSHSYQVTTDRSGEWAFDFNGVQWRTIPPSHNATWTSPSQQRHGGEVWYHYTTQGRGDQMPGDRGSTSKMKFRDVNWADSSWHGSSLAHITPPKPWFKYVHYNGSNFDIWDDRCPN